MEQDGERTSLDELMSSVADSHPPRRRPPGAVLLMGSVVGLFASLATLPKLFYWLFPVPWDFLMWLLGK